MSWLKQSTAVTVVLGPFVDDTDFKTPETALTLSQADIRLSKNGGAFAQTNNAAGATHLEGGDYGVPLNTTDTNTLGSLRVRIAEAGALVVWRDFVVVPAAVWDAFFGAGFLPVKDHAGADLATAASLAAVSAFVDTEVAAIKTKTDQLTFTTANKVDSTIQAAGDFAQGAADKVWATAARTLTAFGFSVTVGTNSDKTGYTLSAPGIQAIWDALTSALTTADSIGKRISDFLTGDAFVRLGAPAGASTAADIAAIKAETALTKADTTTILAAVDTEVAAIKAKTDNLPTDPADASDIATLIAAVQTKLGTPAGASISVDIAAIKTVADAVPTATLNADALLKRDMSAVTGESARSPLNAFRRLRNMVDLATTPGTMLVKKEDDSTDAWTAALTTNVAAAPITKIDPA